MDISGKEKEFALIGTILSLLTIIPYIGGLFAIIGLVLLLISIYNYSNKIFNDKNLFNKFLIGWICNVVGVVFAFVVGVFSFIPLLLSSGSGAEDAMLGMAGLGIIFAVFIVYASFIVSFYFYKESFVLLAKYTNINLFNLAGNILYWGSIAIAAFGLGFIAIYIGWIILAFAFYSIPPSSQLISQKSSEIQQKENESQVKN